MTPQRKYILGLGIAALIFLVDQWTKWLMIGPLQLPYVGQIPDVLPMFNLTWTENRGVSLGLFTAESDAMRWMLVAVTAGIAVFVTAWMVREKKLGDIAALALVLGGALGNIVDRVRFGYVVDFIDFFVGAWHFYIFNLADAAISIGVLIILARSFLSREKRDDQAAQTGTMTSASES